MGWPRASSNELLQERLEAATGNGTARTVGEFVEPVQLQVVLRQLWSTLPAGVQEIEADHIRRLGGVDEALGTYYDESVAAAAGKSHMDEAKLRRLLADALITPNEFRGTAQRGSESTAGIPNAALTELEDRHLVRAEMRAGSRWYELSHDRLIKPILDSNRRVSSAHADQAVQERLQTADDDRIQAEARARRWKWLGIAFGIGLFIAVCTGLAVSVHLYREASDDRDIARSRLSGREALDEELTGRPSAGAVKALEARRLRHTAEADDAVRQTGASPLTVTLRPRGEGGASVVGGSALSSDGRHAAVVYDSGGGWLWDLDRGGKPRPLWPTSDTEASDGGGTVAFSPNASWLAAEAPDGGLRSWNLRERSEPTKLGRHEPCEPAGTRCLVASDDGRIGQVRATDERVRIAVWTRQGGKPTQWTISTTGSLSGARVLLAPDLKTVTLVSQSVDFLRAPGDLGTLRTATFSLVPGAAARRLSDRRNPTAFFPVVTPDGRFLLEDRRVVNLRANRTVARLGLPRDAIAFALSANGRRAAGITSTAGGKRTVVIWDAARPKTPVGEVPVPPSARGAILSPDGSRLLFSGPASIAARPVDGGPGVEVPFDGTVTDSLPMTLSGARILLPSGSVEDLEGAFGARTANRVTDVTVNRRGVTAIRRRPDGGFEVIRHHDVEHSMFLRVRNLQLPVRRAPRREGALGLPPAERRHKGTPPVDRAALSDDGTALAVAGKKTTRVWRIDRERRGRPLSLPAAAYALPGPGGKRVALESGPNQSVSLLDTADARILVPPDADLGYGDLEFSPDGRWFGTLDGRGRLVVYDLTAARPMPRRFPLSPGGTDIEFSPDGRRVALAADDGSTRIWDLMTEDGSTLPGRKGDASEVEWSGDSNRLAVWGGPDGVVRVYSVVRGPAVIELRGHTAAVEDVRFSPGDRYIVSGGRDGTARIWDGSSGRPISVLRGSRAAVTLVHFNADGTQALSLDENHALRLWPCEWWCAPVDDDFVKRVNGRFPDNGID